MLALWHDRSQKQIGAASGIPPKRISQLLHSGEIEDDAFARLLAATSGKPAEAAIVTACLEALAGLEEDQGLSAAERAEVELGVLESVHLVRQVLTESVLRSRDAPARDRYPEAADREPARWHAAMLFQLLQDLDDDERSSVVRVAREYQSWALVERLCDESEALAAHDPGRAAALARLARETARRVRGPKEWVRRVRAFAAAHAATALAATGRLTAADTLFERAQRLWRAGADPDGVLDPGRLFDLEASLCRARRRFKAALSLLEEAREVSRSPGRLLIKMGSTLEILGEPEQAVEALLEAEAQADVRADPRLHDTLHGTLALSLTHVGRFAEAAERAQRVREAATEVGDESGLLRATWLDGRIAAGLGETAEALSLLEQARRGFAARRMGYDVALALLEEAALLLAEGRTAQVRGLTRGLAVAFADEEVHLEALTALRLFLEAADREAATADFARRVLRYLFRARHDPGLRFPS